MSKEFLMIVNPVAGRELNNRKVRKRLIKIRKYLGKKNTIHTILTKPNKTIKEQLIDKNKPDYIIVCGGDGTLNQVTQALFELKWNVPIGFLPLGTTNDFARNFNLPTDISDINLNNLSKSLKKSDLGKFNDKTFNYVAAMGLFSKTSYTTDRKSKNLFGRLAYIINGIKELFSIKSYKLKIKSKEKKIEDEFIYVSISNSNYLGGFDIYRKEDVELDDGEFEVLLVKKPKNFNKSLKLVVDILNGNLNQEDVYFFKASELLIEGNEDLEWSLDGEYSGKQKKIRIKNSQKKVSYIVSK